LHAAPTAHTIPQPPQLLRSVLVSTHASPQRMLGGRQSHTPSRHDAPPVHAIEHPPQFSGLALVLTHAPPHAISGGVHAD
jgi:hypothetical protein